VSPIDGLGESAYAAGSNGANPVQVGVLIDDHTLLSLDADAASLALQLRLVRLILTRV